jgi:histone-lysine N-methyltransferase SETD1
MTATSSTPDMAGSSATNDGITHLSEGMNGSHTNGLASYNQDALERLPARDPHTSIKGSKCTYDPLLDRHRKKNANKGSKPVYETFGLVCAIINILP